jgi:hypothetical protein
MYLYDFAFYDLYIEYYLKSDKKKFCLEIYLDIPKYIHLHVRYNHAFEQCINNYRTT